MPMKWFYYVLKWRAVWWKVGHVHTRDIYNIYVIEVSKRTCLPVLYANTYVVFQNLPRRGSTAWTKVLSIITIGTRPPTRSLGKYQMNIPNICFCSKNMKKDWQNMKKQWRNGKRERRSLKRSKLLNFPYCMKLKRWLTPDWYFICHSYLHYLCTSINCGFVFHILERGKRRKLLTVRWSRLELMVWSLDR